MPHNLRKKSAKPAAAALFSLFSQMAMQITRHISPGKSYACQARPGLTPKMGATTAAAVAAAATEISAAAAAAKRKCDNSSSHDNKH